MLVAVEAQKTQLGLELEEMGRRHGHRFRFLMQAGPIVEPLYWYQGDEQDFYLIPREQDNTEVPAKADDAAKIVITNSLFGRYKVVQQMIGHEVEGFKPYQPEQEGIQDIEVVPVDIEAQVDAVEEKLKKIGEIVAVSASAIAVGTATVLGVFAATLIDPALILVIEEEDGTHIWLEVCNWLEV